MMLALPVTTSNLYDREMLLLNVMKSKKRSSSLTNKFYRTYRDENKEKNAEASTNTVNENSKAR